MKILIAHDEGAVEQLNGSCGRQEISMTVDSGTTETVVGHEMLSNIDTVTGAQQKRGAQYEVANVEMIGHLGEKKFIAVTDNEVVRKLVAQVVDVNQPLLAVMGYCQYRSSCGVR